MLPTINLSIVFLLAAFQLLPDLHQIHVSGNSELAHQQDEEILNLLDPHQDDKSLQSLDHQDEETPYLLPILYDHSPSKDECELLLNNSLAAKNFSPKSKQYTVESDKMDKEISSSCEDIKLRGMYPKSPGSEDEENFPIAFIRVVYRAFHMQELLFNLMYAPQNLYCYALDGKSSNMFHEHMKNLSKCFPNVILTDIEYEVDNAGHNMTRSFMECLKIIWQRPNWKYAVLLQNEDIPIKTNYEMVKILDVLNGSNLINVGRPYLHRLPENTNWSYAALNLFQDPTKNRPDADLKVAKGSTSVTLSKSFVEFIMEHLNLTTLIKTFDSKPYGTDEMLFHSLHSDDSLDAPGGFTRKCIDEQENFTTRYVSWAWSNLPCKSGKYRHNVCIFGLADLLHLKGLQHLFANKMWPEIDYGAIACWAMYFADRKSNNLIVDFESYKQTQIVRFTNNKDLWRKNISLFEC